VVFSCHFGTCRLLGDRKHQPAPVLSSLRRMMASRTDAPSAPRCRMPFQSIHNVTSFPLPIPLHHHTPPPKRVVMMTIQSLTHSPPAKEEKAQMEDYAPITPNSHPASFPHLKHHSDLSHLLPLMKQNVTYPTGHLPPLPLLFLVLKMDMQHWQKMYVIHYYVSFQNVVQVTHPYNLINYIMSVVIFMIIPYIKCFDVSNNTLRYIILLPIHPWEN